MAGMCLNGHAVVDVERQRPSFDHIERGKGKG